MPQFYRAFALSLASWLLAAASPGATLAPPLLDPDRPLDQLTLDVWRSRDDLPQNTIQDITQDQDGFLWLATQEGLARFDGVEFLVFGTYGRRNLKNRFVSTLAVDAEGALWIGTRGSLSRLRHGALTHFTAGDGLKNAQIVDLLVDPQGRLVVATAQSVERAWRDPRSGVESWELLVDSAELDPTGAGVLTEDPQGRLLVATASTLLRITAAGTERLRFATGQDPGRVWCLIEDDDGMLLGTESGLYQARFTDSAGVELQPVEGIGDAPVTALLRDSYGNLWVGTQGAGLWRRTAARTEHLTTAEGLPDDYVNSLLMDREGSLWVGTRQGLARLRDAPLRTMGERQGLEHTFVLGVLEASDGALWIGTDSGVYRRVAATPDGRPGTMRFYSPRDGLTPGYAWALAEGPDGAMWVGSFRGGLSRIAADGTITTWDQEDGLPGESVHALLVDPDGAVWIGGTLGLARLDATTGEILARPLGPDLPRVAARALWRDGQGRLWIGWQGQGVWRYTAADGGHWDRWDISHGLAHNFVLSLSEASDDALWVSTYDGLSHLSVDAVGGQGVTTWMRDQGLPQETVFQALEDGRGHLWISTNRGLYRLPLAQLEVASRGARTLHPAVFDESDGMVSREHTGGFQPAGWRDSRGHLWFPTVQGLVEVDPAHVDALPAPAPVVVTALRYGDQEVYPVAGERLELPRGVREISVSFTAPTFVAPKKLRFLYLLEGVNTGWKDAAEARVAEFTKIPPGLYRLRVRLEEDIRRQGSEAVLELRVPPYIHETWWARGLGLVLLALLIWGAFQLRLRGLVRAKRTLEARVRERTAALARETEKLSEANRQAETTNERLRTTNRELQALNQDLQALHREKDDFLAVAAHDLRTPLVNIRGFSAEVRHDLSALREMLAPTMAHLDDTARRQALTVLERDVPEALGFVEAAAGRMEALTNAILKLYRLGRQELTREMVDLFEVVLRVLENLAYTVDQKGVAVEVGPLPTVWADRAGLEIIAENLLTNAVSYLDAERPGKVEVGGGEMEEWFFFWVEDNGVGIPGEQQAEIFRIFSRAGTRDVPGEGMGLAYVDTLVQRHGGRIECRSTLGEGTRFTVYLPKPQPG